MADRLPRLALATLILAPAYAVAALSLPGLSALSEAAAGLLIVGVEASAAAEALGEGDAVAARKHAEHAWEAFEEYARGLAYDVDPAAAERLEAALRELAGAAERGDAAAAREAAGVVAETVGYIYQSLPGGLSGDFTFGLMVVVKLVEEAVEAYEEGSSTDALLIMEEALRVYRNLPAGEVLGEEAGEIESLFSSAIAALARGGDFEGPAEAVVAEISEAIGIGEAGEGGAVEALGKVRELIEKAVEAYRAGDYAAAEELAASAYLEGYELVEGAVESVSPELNEEIEILIREEFRGAIAQRAPLEEVERIAEEIYRLLGEAERLLSQAATAETVTVTETVEAVTTVTEASPEALALAAGLGVIALAELAVLVRLRSRAPGVMGGGQS